MFCLCYDSEKSEINVQVKLFSAKRCVVFFPGVLRLCGSEHSHTCAGGRTGGLCARSGWGSGQFWFRVMNEHRQRDSDMKQPLPNKLNFCAFMVWRNPQEPAILHRSSVDCITSLMHLFKCLHSRLPLMHFCVF